MSAISRREFFRGAAAHTVAFGMLAGSPSRLGANPLGLPIGSQVYPHRALLKDFPAYLQDDGGHGRDAARTVLADWLRRRLRLAGRRRAGEEDPRRPWHEGGELALQHEGAAREAVREHRVGTRDRHHADDHRQPRRRQRRQRADDGPGQESGRRIQPIAAVAAKAGIQQGLHNEGFEVSMVDGQRTYDLLFGLLDPELVKFQFQMSTIASGLVGADYFANTPAASSRCTSRIST